MVYHIEITKIAENRLKKFNKEVQRRFFNKIKKLKIAPNSYGKPLRSILAGSWEIYFEHKYRIIYSINEERKIVKIESIIHKDEF